MLESLLAFDTAILTWIHGHLHNPFFDWLMPILRNKTTWIPLYVFLAAFMLFNFHKRAWLWMLFFVFAIVLSDTVSTRVFKYRFQRLRPCHTELVGSRITPLVPCGGRYGFVSSHAANHFAMAAFFFFTLGHRLRRARWPVMIWAGTIAFAQVYVGVHYPLDVVAGAALGLIFGWGLAWYYSIRLQHWSIGRDP